MKSYTIYQMAMFLMTLSDT